jgi:hypothetical protein
MLWIVMLMSGSEREEDAIERQKGKMKITANIIKKWSQNTNRIVTFMIVDNDIT